MPGNKSLPIVPFLQRFLFILLGMVLLPLGVNAQGSGRSSTGTGGIHTYSGLRLLSFGTKS
jgi:hypothetical protein